MNTIDLNKLSVYLVETLPKLKDVFEETLSRIVEENAMVEMESRLQVQYDCNKDIMLSAFVHFFETSDAEFEDKTKAIDCVLKEFHSQSLNQRLLTLFFEQANKKAQEIKQVREEMRLKILHTMNNGNQHFLDDFKTEVSWKKTELLGGYTTTIVNFFEHLHKDSNMYQHGYIKKVISKHIDEAFCKAVDFGLQTYLKNAEHSERLALTSWEISKQFWICCPQIIKEKKSLSAKISKEEWQGFWGRFQDVYTKVDNKKVDNKMKM